MQKLLLNRRAFAGLCLAVGGLFATVHAGELETLSARKDLTPDNLCHYFADFTYELSDQVQDAETFLTRKRGDCDDFARLASTLLTERGYKTKLVVVQMEKQTHVVCYVKEAHGYLDFNRRAEKSPVVKSDETLEDVAEKVNESFRSHWRMASEIRYDGNKPVYLDNVFAFATPAVRTNSKPFFATVLPLARSTEPEAPRPSR